MHGQFDPDPKFFILPNLFEKIVKEVFDTADKGHKGFIDKTN